MNGSGPAGELTFDDVRRRLAAITSHLTEVEAGHEATANLVAADREARLAAAELDESEGPAPS